MPRVVVDRTLRWNHETFPPGVAVDMPQDVLETLPDGVVHLMSPDVPVMVMPPPPDTPPRPPVEDRQQREARVRELRNAVAPQPVAPAPQMPDAKPYQPVIRPIQG
jgi:hypothetical protein